MLWKLRWTFSLSGSHNVRHCWLLNVCCPLPMQFFLRPLIGPKITLSVPRPLIGPPGPAPLYLWTQLVNPTCGPNLWTGVIKVSITALVLAVPDNFFSQGQWSLRKAKYLSVPLSVCLSDCPYVRLSACLSVCLSVYLSISLSVCPYVHKCYISLPLMNIYFFLTLVVYYFKNS